MDQLTRCGVPRFNPGETNRDKCHNYKNNTAHPPVDSAVFLVMIVTNVTIGLSRINTYTTKNSGN